MNKEYYEFNPEDAGRFASAVGARTRKRGNQLEFAICPYCRASKDRYTFSISLDTGQFECKRASCSVKGNMITLAKDFSQVFDLGKGVREYYNIDDAGLHFKQFKDAHRITESKPAAITYMQSRGISEEICKKYEITTKPEDEKVIVFPFKDETGELCFVKYRNTKPQKDKSKEWCISGNYKKILFGMNHCEDFGTLVITEGQIDSLSLAEAGIKNAVSVPTGKNGFTWKPNCWNWLTKFDEIVVFGDCENGEITLAKEITGFFPKQVRVVKKSDYRGLKDANDILRTFGKDALVDAVNNAEPVVSFRIQNLSEVERVNLDDLEYFPTGYPTIDKSIGKGFHLGEVNILTGKCGEGKSTFASILVGRMIQNGLKCFCYSGELPDYMFKSWLDYQIAGTTKPTEATRNTIDKWYDRKCYIYDNSAVIDEDENLFDLMSQAVKSLGCQFILIDNLMTAMEDKSTDDLFRQQSNFLKKLTKFAKGFNVIILLIAHPKKGSDTSNDSISGSGDITNRANIVLRYQRDTKDENQSLVFITKNRTTGKLITKGFPVSYDSNSMRVSEIGKPFEEFMTEPKDATFEAIDDMEEIPF